MRTTQGSQQNESRSGKQEDEERFLTRVGITKSNVRVGRTGLEGRMWTMSMGAKRSRRGKLAEPSDQFQQWEARSTYAAEQEGIGEDLKLLW